MAANGRGMTPKAQEMWKKIYEGDPAYGEMQERFESLMVSVLEEAYEDAAKIVEDHFGHDPELEACCKAWKIRHAAKLK